MPHQDPEVCRELTEMRSEISSLHHAVDVVGKKLDSVASQLSVTSSAAVDMERTIAHLSSAFPDGVSNHRSAHQAMIDARKAEEEFYRSMKAEIAKKGIAGAWALLVVVLGLAIIGATAKVQLLLGLPVK